MLYMINFNTPSKNSPSDIAEWAVHKYGKDALYMLEETQECREVFGDSLTKKAIIIIKNKLKLYRFHDKQPDLVVPISELSKTTQNNLKILRARHGISFSPVAKIWKVKQGYGERAKIVKDILIQGTDSHSQIIEYWRHETAGVSAGQTLIYFNGKRHRVTEFI